MSKKFKANKRKRERERKKEKEIESERERERKMVGDVCCGYFVFTLMKKPDKSRLQICVPRAIESQQAYFFIRRTDKDCKDCFAHNKNYTLLD